MAQPQPAAPAQATSQAPPAARRETTPIDALQGTMNLLLTVIGQSLHQPSRLRDPQQRMKMQSVFPTANLRFHEALDRMEEDIAMMQNIVKRDLALKRVVEKQRKEQPIKEERQEQQQVEEDVVMTEPQAVSGEAEEEKKKKTAMTRVMQPVKEEAELQPAPIAPMVAPAPPPQTATATAAEATTTAAAATTTANTTTAEDATSSLLPTTDGPDGPDEMDFSEFFGDDILPDDDPANPTGDDANQLDALPDFGDSNADVSSLLPGLDDYANIPDDSAMPDVPPIVPPTSAAPEPTEFNFGDLTANTTANTTTTTTTTAGQDTTTTTTTTTIAPSQQQQTDIQPDFGDLDFNFDTAGDMGDGGGVGQQGDNTFEDLFDMDSYDFGGGGGAAGGDDINDWMKSL